MNLDWQRLKAVVLESDDWGLCAWSADEQARRALADSPAFRSPAGRRYAGSTLEHAGDVRALARTLAEFRGADGFAPVWQANLIVAAPDYARLRVEGFPSPLALREFPDTPVRWRRTGLWEEVQNAIGQGLWWPELHGLHHIPEHAWIAALRRGESDACRAFEHETAVCLAVEASGEYAPSEPLADRRRRLEWAIARFTTLVGRAPRSFCPPDYRWDHALEAHAAAHGIRVLQGRGEQHGVSLARLRRELLRWGWPGGTRPLFAMPPRIAFEPGAAEARVGVAAALRAAQAAWRNGQPAVISTHRVNYVHLDLASAEAGRGALRDLLQRFCQEGAVFMTDDEVLQLVTAGVSTRPI